MHAHVQVKQNVQHTLAADLQKLSVKFRKQQRGYLNKLRARDEPTRSAGSLAVLDEGPRQTAGDEDFDAGYNESQVLLPVYMRMHRQICTRMYTETQTCILGI